MGCTDENYLRWHTTTNSYLAAETAVDTYKDIRLPQITLARSGAVDILPMNPQLIHAGYMKNTLHWIWDNWNWDKTWGWDCPMTAMNAARMGEPEGSQRIDGQTYLTPIW